jgi:hypothetical protein
MVDGKRILTLTGLTALLGALAFAAPARADVKALCVIDVEAKAATVMPFSKKYVQLVGGKGTYTTQSLVAVCLDIGAGKVPGTIHTGSAHASGTWRNSVALGPAAPVDTPCGHGKVMGVITNQDIHPKFDSLVGTKFAIEFGPPYGAPWQGAFFWHHPGPGGPLRLGKTPTVPKLNQDDDPRYFPKDNPVGFKAYRYAGPVQLSPSLLKPEDTPKRLINLGDKCAKAFHANGAVIVHEA